MKLFNDPCPDDSIWGGGNIFFLHNWRCAGSSMTSLLASNLGEKYIKVGHPFTNTGWPQPYANKPTQITSLQEIRSRLQNGCVIGGHLFVGLEGLLGGRWDLWMNARHPVDRVSSGILRFHSRVTNASNPEQDLMHASDKGLTSKEDVAELLKGPLKREVNGLSKRLAGLAIANEFDINSESHLERVAFLENSYNQEALYNTALRQLNQLKLLILPNAFHASVLCMEKAYGLPPMINIFSDLKHNPIDLGSATDEQKHLVKSLAPALSKTMKSDMMLWKSLEKVFKMQLKKYQVSNDDLKVRELIHREALLIPNWLNEQGMTEELVIKGFAGRIAQRAVEAGELGSSLISTVCRWPRLDRDAAKEIKRLALSAWERRK